MTNDELKARLSDGVALEHAGDEDEVRSAALARIQALEAALRPFAGDTLPSSRPSVLAYNRNGLRCLMSPLQLARDGARVALTEP